ncbi:3-methyladenine DNA glycosylase [Nocardia lasii]|uniref:3-methyladenine DNA glycosylase n=1 Tax=Nocardia lasii TaxID=1616107 RepID=A0ABW1JTH5_9NOCA
MCTADYLDHSPELRVLPASEWRAAARAHRERVEPLVGPYVERRAAGRAHPVIDFLFTYYGHKPSQLQRWHPGFGVGLRGAGEYRGARGYWEVPGERGVFAADPGYLVKRRETIEFVATLLARTSARPAQLSCFGLHEWAMVYRAEEVRHQRVPLRLGRVGTDAVVESMSLRCTHFDAFRFFTPEAVPLNVEPLTRADQVAREQPGCLHANMDLYKWGFKLAPLISSDLLLDCFELACTARELDMRASPYDLADLGYEPIRIETPAGRADYVRAQAAIAETANGLRERLRAACADLVAAQARIDG